jgi:hypothetical protein
MSYDFPHKKIRGSRKLYIKKGTVTPNPNPNHLTLINDPPPSSTSSMWLQCIPQSSLPLSLTLTMTT